MIYPQARMDINKNYMGCWDVFGFTRTKEKKDYSMDE